MHGIEGNSTRRSPPKATPLKISVTRTSIMSPISSPRRKRNQRHFTILPMGLLVLVLVLWFSLLIVSYQHIYNLRNVNRQPTLSGSLSLFDRNVTKQMRSRIVVDENLKTTTRSSFKYSSARSLSNRSGSAEKTGGSYEDDDDDQITDVIHIIHTR